MPRCHNVLQHAMACLDVERGAVFWLWPIQVASTASSCEVASGSFHKSSWSNFESSQSAVVGLSHFRVLHIYIYKVLELQQSKSCQKWSCLAIVPKETLQAHKTTDRRKTDSALCCARRTTEDSERSISFKSCYWRLGLPQIKAISPDRIYHQKTMLKLKKNQVRDRIDPNWYATPERCWVSLKILSPLAPMLANNIMIWTIPATPEHSRGKVAELGVTSKHSCCKAVPNPTAQNHQQWLSGLIELHAYSVSMVNRTCIQIMQSCSRFILEHINMCMCIYIHFK